MMIDTLHYLVTESGSKVVAHCLEYDLVAVASTHHEAIRRLTFITAAHVVTARKQDLPMPLAHKAPQEYWDKYRSLRGKTAGQEVGFVGEGATTYEVVTTVQ